MYRYCSQSCLPTAWYDSDLLQFLVAGLQEQPLGSDLYSNWQSVIIPESPLNLAMRRWSKQGKSSLGLWPILVFKQNVTVTKLRKPFNIYSRFYLLLERLLSIGLVQKDEKEIRWCPLPAYNCYSVLPWC
ncbi:hypothetical protein BDR04DRAFT_130313 [Suillus decipiens]|nr:hypothetical protein BDR04DRAFT_130313 [Suillus decipiens]